MTTIESAVNHFFNLHSGQKVINKAIIYNRLPAKAVNFCLRELARWYVTNMVTDCLRKSTKLIKFRWQDDMMSGKSHPIEQIDLKRRQVG